MRPFCSQLLSTALGAFVFCASLAAAQPTGHNERLLAALEPFEALTEAGLDGNAAKIKKAVREAAAEHDATRGLLPSEAAVAFDRAWNNVAAAAPKGDTLEVALNGAELFKLVASALDASAKIPKEISLLDHAGFRTKTLLKAAPQDWQALAATAAEANGYWAKIRDRVTDTKLQAAMDHAQQGLVTAAQKKDAALGATATREELDLVDDLEKYFDK